MGFSGPAFVSAGCGRTHWAPNPPIRLREPPPPCAWESLLGTPSYPSTKEHSYINSTKARCLGNVRLSFCIIFSISIGILWASISHSPDNNFEYVNIQFRSPRNKERKSIKTCHFYKLGPTQIWTSKWFLNMVY